MGHDSVTIAADYPYYQWNWWWSTLFERWWGELNPYYGCWDTKWVCIWCYTLQLQNAHVGAYTAALTCFNLSSWILRSEIHNTCSFDTTISRSESSGVLGMQDWCTPRALSGLVRLDSRYFRIGSFPISHAHLKLHNISRRRARAKERKAAHHAPNARWLVMSHADLDFWVKTSKRMFFQANSILKNLVFLLMAYSDSQTIAVYLHSGIREASTAVIPTQQSCL